MFSIQKTILFIAQAFLTFLNVWHFIVVNLYEEKEKQSSLGDRESMKKAWHLHQKAIAVMQNVRFDLIWFIFKAFSLFLKEQYVSWLFRTKYFEKKFNLQLLYLPMVSQTFILP